MKFSKLLSFAFLLQFIPTLLSTAQAAQGSKLFTAYIGAEFLNITFSDVPINSHVDFHFILSFAIDYTTTSPPTLTNGKFNIFWDDTNLSPSQVDSIKRKHGNVKISLSLGGSNVGNDSVYFKADSVKSWVSNAVSSLTKIIKEYHLDGIDIDYKQFNEDPDTFVECIGQLLTILKSNRVISFASIAPFNDTQVQTRYLALWKKYGHLIDYVNFQFYAYAQNTTTSQFLSYYETQSSNYKGGKVLVSYISDGSGGLSPKAGFFKACKILKKQGKLDGIFVWSADDSKASRFRYEKKSQTLLARAH